MMENGGWKMKNEEAASLSALSSIFAGCEIFVLFVVDPSGFEKSVFIRVHPWLYVLASLAGLPKGTDISVAATNVW
jgi:hypothetical protein